MKRLADADVFSGAVLLAKDGVPVYKAVYGTANKDYGVPNKIDTKFNLGSMNKMFTAVAIAQLVEKGKALVRRSAVEVYSGLSRCRVRQKDPDQTPFEPYGGARGLFQQALSGHVAK